jgi:hypothetical protein
MKPAFSISLLLGQAAVVFVAFKAGEAVRPRQAVAKSWESYTTEIPAGTALNPVPLKVQNCNPAFLIRGSYLVNSRQHCNFCHTCPPYATDAKGIPPGVLLPVNAANYMAGGRRFGAADDPDAPVSANLTPDLKTGLPGGLTFKEFRLALRTGRAHKTGHTLQVMPWPLFKDMTDTELFEIYEYLKSIPHAEPGVERVAVAGLHNDTDPKASE